MESLFTICAALCLVSLHIGTTYGAVDCSVYLRCDDCLVADPSCMWCDDKAVLMTIASDPNNTESAKLCGDSQRMATLRCSKIVNPPSIISEERAPAGQSVSLSSATVKLRPGKTARIPIAVSPPQSAAIDMYLLVDYTNTMAAYLRSFGDIVEELVARMNNITSEFRMGIGTFVDKTVLPFNNPQIQDNPCVSDGTTCQPFFDFRHDISLTSNASELTSFLQSNQISGGLDPAEGILDALLQTAVCEEMIGWRPKGESQRIVLALTNADYHYALDARVGGIAKLPSAQCEIDPITRMYQTSRGVEYPSAAFIGSILNENQVTPIFGSDSGPRTLYFNLASAIVNAVVASLTPVTATLLDEVVDVFQRVSGTVIPTIIIPDAARNLLTIAIRPSDNCSPGSVALNSSVTCLNIKYPQSVSYEMTIDSTSALCGMDPFNVMVQFIRFGSVNVTIIPSCSCDCTDDAVEDSSMCNSLGTLECSSCRCNDLRQGATCQCPVVTGQQELGCTEPGSEEVCSGRGRCNCGRCQCNAVNGETYHGQYCQFDPSNCPTGRDSNSDLKSCSGRGECINFQCVCGDGFSGRTCDCTDDKSTCVYPLGDPSKLCSGEGRCICGQCVCNDYSLTLGQYCEDCLPCRASCSLVSPCVLCKIVDGMSCPANLSCGRISINETTLANVTQNLKTCSIRQGSCEVRYLLDRRVQGDESDITVFLDNSQSALPVLRRGSTECQQTTLIWPIFVGIIGGTIVIGIIILLLWRGCTYFGEYLEYQQWERSVKNDTENTGVNPLFMGPNTEYSNPRYAGRRR